MPRELQIPSPPKLALGTYLHDSSFNKGYALQRSNNIYGTPITTTLSAAITTTGQTSITVSSAAAPLPQSGNFDIYIDAEKLTVTAGQGTTTWTVTRGAGNTTAATHLTAATVNLVQNPVPPRICHWFLDWGHWAAQSGADYAADGALNPNYWDAALAAAPGSVPLMTYQPYDYAGTMPQATYALSAINAGNHDAKIDGMAADIVAWGKPMYIRFAHEMNGNWYPWGSGVNSNTAAGYISAFQRVVSRFRTAGATKVRWVWCPNIGNAAFAQFYPGDDYVDWVGIDGYNKGTVNANTWTRFLDLFATDYRQIEAITNKPLMIPETGSNESGGNKADWIRDMFQTLPTAFPKVKAVVWYDFNVSPDFTEMALDSSATATAAFRQAMASPRNRGTLP